MRKRLFTILSFFLLIFISVMNICAQTSLEPKIEWTKKQHMAKGFVNTLTHLDTKENSFIFLYKTAAEGTFSKSHSYLVKMDMLTGKPQDLKLELKDGGAKRDWRHVRALDDRLYIFSSFQNKKDKRHYIFVETVNKEKLEYNKDARKIGEISYKDVDGSKLDNFVVTVSPNKERILLSYSIVDGNTITSMGIQVFDKDLNPLWTRESDFPRIEGKEVFVGNYTIDDEGNVYLGQNRYDKKNEVWNLYLTCFPVNNGEPRVQEVVFSGDKYARNETIICSPSGEIICAGLYSSPGKMSVSGTFSQIFSPQLGTLLSKDEKEFDEDFITMGMKDKDAEKMMENKDKGKEFDEGYRYYIDKKYQRKDGGFSLIAEKFKLQTQTVRNGNMVSTYYYYNFNDIIILTFNTDGSIRWVQKIPKAQRLVNSERLFGSYYASIDDEDNIDILYNEHVKDKMSDKAQPLMVRIDNKGELSFKELFKEDKEVRKSFAPTFARKLLSDNKYLLGRVNLSRWGARGTFIHWGITELK
ncbi:hypothetical protein JGH11_09980 [Dysgonomonas sp. Marseille-P4677]|uniref:hypothetical protein n=1 Tax=Dysgonomonas sp. Marseille-P4677 TaxID=2364790 RepID=UPI001912D6CB|nr:hypothetical protein [Dysgonomonas sp. Marseille-P4677]MBK5721197.1 hypothetical protein [Dysgonomonas sp. Marseille-P4677]